MVGMVGNWSASSEMGGINFNVDAYLAFMYALASVRYNSAVWLSIKSVGWIKGLIDESSKLEESG